MTKRDKKIYKIYRRYQEDVWGDLKKKGMDYKLSFFFEFMVNKRERIRRPRFVFDASKTPIHKELKRPKVKSLFYLEKQKLKRFYGDLSEQEFKQLSNAFSYKKTRRHQGYIFLLGLESRLDTLCYRFHLSINIKEGRKFAEDGWLKVDGKIIRSHNFCIKKNNILTFSKPKRVVDIWKRKMDEKIMIKKYLEPFPDQFWISYKHLLFKYNPTNEPKFRFHFPYLVRYAEHISRYY
jgi:ribosomal protein S4